MPSTTEGGVNFFTPSLLYAAAKMYYEDDATQAEVAAELGCSRATVSRILSEARRSGIVRIDVIAPSEIDRGDLDARLAAALGLRQVHLCADIPAPGPGKSTTDIMGRYLAPTLSAALAKVGLIAGDVLLVSSGRTVYEVARHDLRAIPGINVAPTVGGHDQPEEWYQTNEITRLVANQLGGRPNYLFAPALPGPDLFATVHSDPAIQRVIELWPRARCVVMGVGAPPLLRSDIPGFVPTGSSTLRDAVGDVCSRFYDRNGDAVDFPGRDRLIAIELSVLQQIPSSIAVAIGVEKVPSILAAAKRGYFKELVTDPATAALLLSAS